MPRPTPNDTAALVQQAQQGNSRAFEELVQQLGDRLWRSALVMCRDEHAARDLVQESWLEAWKGLHRFDGRCQFSTWLYGILRHRNLKRIRRTARKPLLLLPDPDDGRKPDPGQPMPSMDFERQEAHAVLKEALRALPEPQRQVLELRFFADATLADIAVALDCPEGTVKSRIHHARRQIARSWRELDSEWENI